MKLCVYVKHTQFIKCTEKLFVILFLGDEIDLYYDSVVFFLVYSINKFIKFNI